MTKSTQRVEQSYIDGFVSAQDMVNQIQELLFDLPSPESDADIHWGHVGYLNEVNDRLYSIIEFMAGEE